MHEREVLAHDAPLGERALQQAVGLIGAGDDEQAGRVPVQAMDDAGALRDRRRRPRRVPAVGRACLTMSARGVHDQAGRLVDHEQVLVLVGDRVDGEVIVLGG